MRNCFGTAILKLAVGYLALANMALIAWPNAELQQFVLLLSLILFFISCVRATGYWLNPFFLFGLTAAMFLSGRILVHPFTDDLSNMLGDWFYYGPLSKRAVMLAAGAISSFYCGISLVLKKNHRPIKVRSDRDLLQFSLIALALLFPFFIYHAYENIKIYQAADYLSLYLNGGPDGIVYKVGGWFILAIFTALASKPTAGLSYLLFILGLIFCILESLTGARGIPLACLIMLCWLFAVVRGIKVHWPIFIAALLLLIVFADFLGRARSGIATLPNIFSILRLVSGFIYSQGTTFLFLVGVGDYLHKFTFGDAVSSSFSQLYDWLGSVFNWSHTDALQTFGVQTASLAHRIASLVNPKMYGDGMGMGGSVVGEAMLYSLYLGPLLTGMLVAGIMRGVYRLTAYGPVGLAWFSYTFSFILLLPRDTLLCFFVPSIKILLLLSVFLIIKKANERIQLRNTKRCNGYRANLSEGASTRANY